MEGRRKGEEEGPLFSPHIPGGFPGNGYVFPMVFGQARVDPGWALIIPPSHFFLSGPEMIVYS